MGRLDGHCDRVDRQRRAITALREWRLRVPRVDVYREPFFLLELFFAVVLLPFAFLLALDEPVAVFLI
jgi:hypothetical protein